MRSFRSDQCSWQVNRGGRCTLKFFDGSVEMVIVLDPEQMRQIAKDLMSAAEQLEADATAATADLLASLKGGPT